MSELRPQCARPMWTSLSLLLGTAFLLISCSRNAGPGAPGPLGKWETLEECRLQDHRANDGDSFHVRHQRGEYIFRLYFVDVPEADTSESERVQEQCRYFGVTTNELLNMGRKAKARAEELLNKGFMWKEGFTATTRWQDAMGRTTRYFAVVTVDGKDLGEILVSEGLARAKGTVAILPHGVPAKVQMRKLERLEAAARAGGVGLWAQSNKGKKQNWLSKTWEWLTRKEASRK